MQINHYLFPIRTLSLSKCQSAQEATQNIHLTFNHAQQIIEMGFLLGIGGVITYKKSHLPDVLREIPLEYLVLETDAPFLPPVPYRGQRNESAYIYEIALKLADIKQLTLDVVARVTTENAKKLFRLT